MSIFSNLTGTSAADPPDLDAKLADAEAALPDLERGHRQAALAVACGDEGANDAYQAAEAALEAARERVRLLRAAVAEMRELRSERDAKARAEVRAAQVAAVRAHLGRRDAAADRLARALAEAGDAWRDLLKHSAAAHAARPIGEEWPAGALCAVAQLQDAVANEIHRTSGDPAIGNLQSMVPPRQIAFQHLGVPPGMPEFADVMRAASAHAMDAITGRPRTLPAEVAAIAPEPIEPAPIAIPEQIEPMAGEPELAPAPATADVMPIHVPVIARRA